MNRSRAFATESGLREDRARMVWCIVGTAEYQEGATSSSHEKNLSALNPGVHTTSAPVESDESKGAMRPWMWNSGITQGLMWRTYTESGTLAYSFTDTLVKMHPYYIARAIGGAMFFVGAVIGAFNVVMTIRSVGHQAQQLDYPTGSEANEPAVPAAE